jgi:hypothetical protein
MLMFLSPGRFLLRTEAPRFVESLFHASAPDMRSCTAVYHTTGGRPRSEGRDVDPRDLAALGEVDLYR